MRVHLKKLLSVFLFFMFMMIHCMRKTTIDPMQTEIVDAGRLYEPNADESSEFILYLKDKNGIRIVAHHCIEQTFQEMRHSRRSKISASKAIEQKMMFLQNVRM